MEPTTPPLLLRPRLLAALIALLVIANGGALVQTPFYAIGPGPATDILSEVDIDGAPTYPSKGKLLITTVGVSTTPLDLWELLFVGIAPTQNAIHRHRLIPGDVTDEQQDFRNRVDMERSKIGAQVAAFLAVGERVTRLSGGRVVGIADSGASAGKLQVGDRILAVNGTEIGTHDEVVTAVRRVGVGDTVRIAVERDGERTEVAVVTKPLASDPKVPVIGVLVDQAYGLPYEVDIDTQRISGPSGGLVFALSIVDRLTPEDLTGGETIAVTGTLTLASDGDGLVGQIGGIGEKVRAARAVGASAFIMPSENAAEARKAGPGDMEIIAVDRLSEALQALRRLSADRRV